ncbi:hypothetical protein B0W47_04245 [Komagataeibacter nataicola]|uniref:Transcriptional regulator n=1 Tax=Komagataeibacter nataicola TaxID=265960 RepID=A0A9N7C5I7_9PROT|nr:MerR family transcriptional regulator [Komagataeibacter nataicola]AQU86801.1 hypothetical protein B0W47_04245 [Komagataeibacter nataicola]PYD67822.1 transcriptional regulator [Komagataeibacter nataicola]WEQ56248.1 MerR family transcriptional regulator [Komagataeibacter nataicola]WNM07827.1 MerR family transcriptional regulator [Komagataeibacter nataicola]GBR24416.1 transcriptional regulator [Komagataeibacter nataicola NRIC 0616]
MTTEHFPGGTIEPGTDCLPIYEVARELGLAQHVMRMWEASFPQLQPLRGPVGRRYYRPQDITVLREIADLLYVRKLSVAQAQAELARETLAAPESEGEVVTPPAESPVAQAPMAQAPVTQDAPLEAEPATEAATAGIQVTVIEEVVETVVACEAPPAEAPPVPEAEAPAPVEAAATGADVAPANEDLVETAAQEPADEPEQPPLEQIVMIEVERLQAENTVLRDSLRGVLVELQALRQMVPV